VLEDKLALVLWQFPAGLRAEAAKEHFFNFLPRLPPSVRHVFEFRHRSWFTEDVFARLDQVDAGFVINSSPHIPSVDRVTGGLLYVRFHGPEKLYNSSYSHEQLEAWAARIRPHLERDNVFLFFNNTFSGQALENAREMHALLTR
jgi:uncharacterized protein YecE (DUF72 family)